MIARCRFYYADGTCEMREVSLYAGQRYPPQQWRVPVRKQPWADWLALEAAPLDSELPEFIVHTFTLRRYRYGDAFIGPHRDADYHEEKAP